MKIQILSVTNHQKQTGNQVLTVKYDKETQSLVSFSDVSCLKFKNLDLPIESGFYSNDTLASIAKLMDDATELVAKDNQVVALVNGKKVKIKLESVLQEEITDWSIIAEQEANYSLVLDKEPLLAKLNASSFFVETSNPNSDFLLVGDLIAAHNTRSAHVSSLEGQDPESLELKSGFDLNLPTTALKQLITFLKESKEEQVTLSQTKTGLDVILEDSSISFTKTNKPTAIGANLLGIIKTSLAAAKESNLVIGDLVEALKIAKVVDPKENLHYLEDTFTMNRKQFEMEVTEVCNNTPQFVVNTKILEGCLFNANSLTMKAVSKDGVKGEMLLFADYSGGAISMAMLIQ